MLAVGIAGGACDRRVHGEPRQRAAIADAAPRQRRGRERRRRRSGRARRERRAGAGWREVTIPAGTTLPVVLDTSVGSDTSRVEQPVQRASRARDRRRRRRRCSPQGSRVSGVVTDATRSGKVKGRAHVAVRFDYADAARRRRALPHPDGGGRPHRAGDEEEGRARRSARRPRAARSSARIVGGKKGAAIGDGGRRRRRHGGRPVDARQGSAAARRGARADAAPRRAAHVRVRS